jgi:oligopeptide transport system substrate-binding protein
VVRVSFIKDPAIAFAAYEKGELDIVLLGPAQIVQVRQKRELQPEFKAYAQLSTTGVTFNVASGALTNPRVRQALAGGFDRDEYAQVVREGAVLPAYGWLPPGIPGYDGQAGSQYRNAIERSKTLLREAGFEGGRGVSVEILIANTATSKLTAEWLQQQWQKHLGVTVTIRALEPATYVSERVKGNFSVLLGGWAADYPDPQNWWPPFRTGAGLNAGKYSSAEFDRLMDQADAELDAAKRLEIYGRAQQIFFTDAPFAPLFYGSRSVLVKPYVKGAVTTTMEGAIPMGNFLDRVMISGKQR